MGMLNQHEIIIHSSCLAWLTSAHCMHYEIWPVKIKFCFYLKIKMNRGVWIIWMSAIGLELKTNTFKKFKNLIILERIKYTNVQQFGV